MLTIAVQNFRGIKDARIECSRIALLCGQNEQGKSSTIDAIRSVLDGTAQPYGLKKGDLEGELLYTGSAQAHGTITESNEGHDDRSMQMRWPAGDKASMGAPFRATGFATGSVVFTSLEDREKARALATYLRTEPTREEFDEALKDSGLTPDQIEAAWKDIVKLGWDGAWAEHKTQGTKLKGAWEQITGASYGIKAGGNWKPKGWTPAHDAQTDADIAEWVKEAQSAHDAGIGKVAINEDERKRLEAAVKNIPKLQELVDTRKKDGERARANRTKAEEAIRKIPVLPPDKWPECPHCKKAVQIHGNDTLRIPPKALDEAERKKIIVQVEEAERILREAQEAYQTAADSWTVANNDLTAAMDAKAAIEKADPEAAAIDMDALRQDLAEAKANVAAREKIRSALNKHVEVITKLNLVEALAPDGLRQKKLASKLEGFNLRLAALCEVAGWGPVAVDQTGAVELNGIQYALCARSGRMRCDVTLQVAFAMIDGSEIVLVDDADLLDGKGRNGLFSLLDHSELYAVVGMMLIKVAQAPDLSAAGLGTSYWVAGAVTERLEEFKAKAA